MFTSMPISWGTAEYEYYHFAMLRDAYFRRNAFIVNDEFVLKKDEKYKFRNASQCRASFYLFMIYRGNTNAALNVKGYTSRVEQRTIVPNQLFAPYRMRIYDDVTDLDTSYVENTSELELDIVLLFIPVQSVSIREILSTQQVFYGSSALVSSPTPITSFSFEHGVVTLQQSANIIFAEDTFVSKLIVHCSANNDVTLLNKSGMVIPSIRPSEYIDEYIHVEYADLGLYGNLYSVSVSPCAVHAEVLHVISTDQSAQIILLDENGQKAKAARVSSVSTLTEGALITSYFVSDGIIHLRGQGRSYEVDIYMLTDTGKQKISATVTPQLDEFVIGASPPAPPR